MKCSLLTLSCYLDSELEAGRIGEVEAHLVGCARCRGGLEHLTEESRRIAALAPAHVPDHSVHALLEQLNLIGPDDPLPERTEIELDGWGSSGGLETQPWKRDGHAPALPLTARRHDYLRRRSLAARESDGSGSGGEEARHEPSADPSGVAFSNAGEQSTSRASSLLAPARPSVTPELPFPPFVPAGAAATPQAPPGDSSVSSTWTSPSDADPWSATHPPSAEAAAPDFALHEWDAIDGDEEGPRQAPERAARPSLLGRVRERVAMYRALSRGPVDDFDDSVQVVSGFGAPLRAKQPIRSGRRAAGGAATRDAAGAATSADLTGTTQPRPAWGRPGLGGTGLGPPVRADHAAPAAEPLPGIAFPPSPPSWASRPRPWVESAPPAAEAGVGPPPLAQAGAGAAPPTHAPSVAPAPTTAADPRAATRGRIPGWGDAATSVPPSATPEPEWVPSVDYPVPQRAAGADVAGAGPGRHARQARPGAAMPAAVAGIGRHAARLRGQAPRRLVGALAAVAVLTLIGLLTGRSTSPNPAATPVASVQKPPAGQRPQPSNLPGVVVPPNPSAAAGSLRASAAPPSAPGAASAPASVAPAAPAAPAATTAGLTDPHLLGDGAAGYGLRGIRYGAHPAGYRVVFDLAAAGVSAGTPRVVVGTHDPKTVWVELFGVSSGPVRQPDPTVVSGVALLPRDTVPGATVYALSLVHPVTVSPGYVTGPVRLVLDLH